MFNLEFLMLYYFSKAFVKIRTNFRFLSDQSLSVFPWLLIKSCLLLRNGNHSAIEYVLSRSIACDAMVIKLLLEQQRIFRECFLMKCTGILLS